MAEDRAAWRHGIGCKYKVILWSPQRMYMQWAVGRRPQNSCCGQPFSGPRTRKMLRIRCCCTPMAGNGYTLEFRFALRSSCSGFKPTDKHHGEAKIFSGLARVRIPPREYVSRLRAWGTRPSQQWRAALANPYTFGYRARAAVCQQGPAAASQSAAFTERLHAVRERGG